MRMPRVWAPLLMPSSCLAITSLRSPDTSWVRVRELISLRSESLMIGARRSAAADSSPPVAR